MIPVTITPTQLSYIDTPMYKTQVKNKPFLAKGSKVVRCEVCLLAKKYCICQYTKAHSLDPSAPLEIWLLMHKEESYKPTNTGRLIEHCLPESTRRFYWHRTEPDPVFLELLKDPRYQPHIIYPGDREGIAHRVVSEVEKTNGKIPVFIILDGSWRQAGRMFRLSKYLQHLPILPLNTQRHSLYKLRKAPDEFHLCTCEVAMELLLIHQQTKAAGALSEYFQYFNDYYDRSRRNAPLDSISE